MVDLKTTYMGLTLRNPLIVASCSLVSSVDQIKKCEEHGAGAVVMKSLFEEQLEMEANNLYESSGGVWHSEGYNYIRKMNMDFSENDYLKVVREAKQNVSIPVIPSINCHTPQGWTKFALKLEREGADALELNISVLPGDPKVAGDDIENLYYSILESVKTWIKIPVAVKIGPYFTSLARFATELSWRGASALVLFNRFYQLDIDIENLKLKAGNRFSSPEETHLPLRWIAMLAGKLDCDMAASTGVHGANECIKHLLAGAAAVQICSTLYLKGLAHIGTILHDLEQWMKTHDYDSLVKFQGMLRQEKSHDPAAYERLQYIRALVGIE